MRYLMAALAVVTCPCHLPILLAVLGSTALGAAMSEYVGLTVLALSALFVVSAWSAVRMFSRDAQPRRRLRSVDEIRRPAGLHAGRRERAGSTPGGAVSKPQVHPSRRRRLLTWDDHSS